MIGPIPVKWEVWAAGAGAEPVKDGSDELGSAVNQVEKEVAKHANATGWLWDGLISFRYGPVNGIYGWTQVVLREEGPDGKAR
ncbi:MAG TPA: hypothetical protein VGH54_28120 [Mycobacterium sp.]|uniref:hypothetical protein n=1 Tax=Mycobacterium sp. TaxID=1785 RepID=UPI002F40CDF4